MSYEPEVSVVMAVYNGEANISNSIESILCQEEVSFELIVVDDGSTDGSPHILQQYAARDARVRVFNQPNQGLTCALISGCRMARAEFIARQDVGDVSLPGRFAKQVACARDNRSAALVSCGTSFIGPGGEFLYEVVRDPSTATTRLTSLDLGEIEGPSHHGATLFRRSTYHKVRGYRSAFYFAQDLDLWVRFAEQGEHVVMPEVLYQASFNAAAISALYRKEQVGTARLILECARLRREGLNDNEPLEQARRIRPGYGRRPGRLARARALYFLGTCLSRNNTKEASRYFKQSLLAWPLHLKSAARLIVR